MFITTTYVKRKTNTKKYTWIVKQWTNIQIKPVQACIIIMLYILGLGAHSYTTQLWGLTVIQLNWHYAL